MDKAKYIISEDRIDTNCKRFRKAFEGVDVIPAYSVKTNHIPDIVKRFSDNGFLTEVVSDLEVDIASIIGIPMSRIVYNGPMKGERAYDVGSGGGIVSFDSLDDLHSMILPKNTRCMFRVAVNISNGVDTRFGIKPNEVYDAVKEAKARGYSTVGIHCHVTKGRSVSDWEEKLCVMAEVYRGVRHLLTEKIVDFGGNMYSPQSSYVPNRYDDYATYDDYGDMFREMKVMFPGAVFMLEMGTSVVGNCMKFFADVLSIKRTDRNTYVLLDCCKYNLGWATDRYNFPIRIIHKETANKFEVKDAYFVGRLCTEGDVIYTGYTGKIAPGDTVEFDCVGAYTAVVKPPFIIGQAPVYYESNGELRLIKRRETAEDILGTYEKRR